MPEYRLDYTLYATVRIECSGHVFIEAEDDQEAQREALLRMASLDGLEGAGEVYELLHGKVDSFDITHNEANLNALVDEGGTYVQFDDEEG